MGQNTLGVALGVTVACLTAACSGGDTVKEASPPLVSGVYLENRDTSVRPQDDFFHYVNGGWLATNEIPADRSNDGPFYRLRESADEDVRVIIETAAASEAPSGSSAWRIALLYNSFMNEARVNSLGIDPLQDELLMIERIARPDELMAYFAYSTLVGLKSPLEISIYADFKQPDVYRTYFFQSGLGLPNSDYYVDDSDKGQAIIAAYQAYMRRLFLQLGYEESAADAATNATWALEEAMAASHRPPEQNRNYPLWYNLRGQGQDPLPEGVDWAAYLIALGLTTDRVVSLAQPEFFEGFAKLLAETPMPVWRDYLKLRLISSSALYLDQELQELSFDFYSRTLQGTPEMRPRWKRGVQFVNGSVGEAVGEIYVREHFPPEAKSRMDELVENLVAAYRDSIESLDWMGEDTRSNALAKLEKFTSNIGYPDEWKDYSSMQLDDNLLRNVRAVNRWDSERQLARIDEPVDRREWSMSPQTVNAYFSPVQNSINFPAAILQPPFFDLSADDAINYGAIGSVIGHEIGHGFDDSGSEFDGDGRLHNWWTDDDRASFKNLTADLIAQYDAFEVLPGVNVNGTLTQGENIGDLAGVSIAYKAYQQSLAGSEAPVLDGYTGDQRFFIGFAQAFMGKSRDERARLQVATDPHSPSLFRVNGTLSNVDAFYQAFALEAGDALYRPSGDRVRIW